MNRKRILDIFLDKRTICTDTRNILADSIYIALKGENFNGNKFALNALNSGCSYAIVDEVISNDSRIIQVDDCLNSLQELATDYRQTLEIPIIAISGSNGKTTTKELMAAALETEKSVFYTKGNLNNHIGVPISILSIKPENEIAIIEMGANHKKEIESLCKIAQPTHGLLTNIGKAHLEGFGGEEGVISGKKELYNYLVENDGEFFQNMDDIHISKFTEIRCIAYGSDKTLAYIGISNPSQKQVTVDVITPNGDTSIQTQLIGSYNAPNILAATVIADYFGIELDAIKKGIEAYIPENHRSQLIEKNGFNIIMDAYNANPSSMEVAIDNLNITDGNKYFILGDMKELGKTSLNEHQELVDKLKQLNLNGVLVGTEFLKTKGPFPVFENNSEASLYIQKQSWPLGTTILIKASRGIALENIFESI